MTDEKSRERAARSRERSGEARWKVAEAGAAEEGAEAQVEASPRSDKPEADWENEGGALDRQSKARPANVRP
jgi:hypothetical protein